MSDLMPISSGKRIKSAGRLPAEELSNALAVQVRVAEECRVVSGPPEVQVRVCSQVKPIPPCNWIASAARAL